MIAISSGMGVLLLYIGNTNTIQGISTIVVRIGVTAGPIYNL